MNTQRLLQIIGLGLIIWLLSACGGMLTEPTTAPTPVPTATLEATTVSAESGFITGRVHGQAPPTPPMVVYAVDNATGAWAFTETQQTDGEAPFTLAVPAGTYQVFAFSEVGPFAGYASEDGWSLGTVTVAAGQSVSDIMVRPPSQSECGSTFGLSASPDRTHCDRTSQHPKQQRARGGDAPLFPSDAALHCHQQRGVGKPQPKA